MALSVTGNNLIHDYKVDMTGDERKRAFKAEADIQGLTLSAAALLRCGVTWEHLSRGISDTYDTPLSADVKEKFAEFLGRSVADVFGSNEAAA